MGHIKNLSEENVKWSAQNLPHLVLSNLHVKTCSFHYMTISGMSAIVLACHLAHMACVAELKSRWWGISSNFCSIVNLRRLHRLFKSDVLLQRPHLKVCTRNYIAIKVLMKWRWWRKNRRCRVKSTFLSRVKLARVFLQQGKHLSLVAYCLGPPTDIRHFLNSIPGVIWQQWPSCRLKAQLH
jgi:hypothetical protein